MLIKIKKILASKNFRSYFSLGSLSMYVVAVVSLSVAWSSTKVIQRNYKLMKQISVLEQEVSIAEQKVENQKLENQYYSSDAFLELAARRQLNKAEPGEKLLIISKSVARSKIPAGTDEEPAEQTGQEDKLSNWQAWLQFLTGRGLND